MTDRFFTPLQICQRLLDAVRTHPQSVADFSAGDAALLKLAAEKWPEAKIIATDINTGLVKRLKHCHPSWFVGKCDFLDKASRCKVAVLHDRLRSVDLILLNPPFSCRGASHTVCELDGRSVKCSKSLAFLITALSYLSPNGECAAILPLNTFSTQRNAEAWQMLKMHFTLDHIGSTSRGAFSGCVARCSMVVLRPRKRAPKCTPIKPKKLRRTIPVRVLRGKIQMHAVPIGKEHLVHSTDLVNHKVVLNGHTTKPSQYSISGPCVLLPRVGKPMASKVALYNGRSAISLSDCVIGIQCTSMENAKIVLDKLVCAEDRLKNAYVHYCAPYLTLTNLKSLLESLGCRPA